MCPPWVGVQGSSKLRARPKPLIEKGLNRARRTLFRGDGSSYLLLELPELLGLLGLEGAFSKALVLVEPVLELPLAPDVLEPLGDDVEPPEADLLLSRSHPVTRAVPRDNASAATNAVNFMLTSMVVCAKEKGARNGPRTRLHEDRALYGSRRPCEIPRGTRAARRRDASVASFGTPPRRRLPAAAKPGRLQERIPLHAQAAMGVHPARRDGDRAAGRELAPVRSRSALLRGRRAAGRRAVRCQAARTLERAARRRAARHAVPEALAVRPAVKHARRAALRPAQERRRALRKVAPLAVGDEQRARVIGGRGREHELLALACDFGERGLDRPAARESAEFEQRRAFAVGAKPVEHRVQRRLLPAQAQERRAGPHRHQRKALVERGRAERDQRGELAAAARPGPHESAARALVARLVQARVLRAVKREVTRCA